MDLDRGVLARLDRKLLAGLGQNETYRMVRVPATAAKWSTWKRYCDSAGISMGRAIVALIDRELVSVFRDPPGDGVSPYLMFMPIVTQFQLALDMAMATSAPAGFGHGYYAQDYIGPWVQMTSPDPWTDADTERLKAHCDNGFQNGCSND